MVSFAMEIWRETYREQYLWGKEGSNGSELKQKGECAQCSVRHCNDSTAARILVSYSQIL